MAGSIAQVEAVIWSQARNLNNADPLIARTAMQAVLAAVTAHTQNEAGRIVAARRRALQEAS